MSESGGETVGGGGEHAVIARYRLAQEGFGEPGDRAAVREVARVVADAVGRAGAGEFDGNEFGGGEAVLYAYGPDADALFAVMEAALRGLPFRPAHVILRYGSAADPTAAQVRLDL